MVWCSIGTHPHDAGVESEKQITAEKMIEWANAQEKIIAIGEAGLDYHYDYAPRADQEAAFRKQIQVAKETGLPLVIHSREAEENTMKILREEGACDGQKQKLSCIVLALTNGWHGNQLKRVFMFLFPG